MQHQNCSLCSFLEDFERAFQKSGEGTLLPQAAANLIVLHDLKPESFNLGGEPPIIIPSSRLMQLRQCPQCETFYLYRTDYEFIWGGSEDEQILQRLTNEQALACHEKLVSTFNSPATSFPTENLNLAKQEETVLETIRKNKNETIRTLEVALSTGDADIINEALENLEKGSCDYLELIPILKRVREVDFYYFDDNGAGGLPRPVSDRISYEYSAQNLIENIEENAKFESSSLTAHALKSNDPELIKNTLESLKTRGYCDDKNLIPILTKIVRKNVYKIRDYSSSTPNYHLEALAREVITIIHKNYQRDKSDESCRLCYMLQDDQKINKDGGEKFPDAFVKLIPSGIDFNSPFYRCPGCGLYYYWIYSSFQEEQLLRLSLKSSRLLENILSNVPQNPISPDEVKYLLKNVSLESLVPALRKQIFSVPSMIKPFIPHLLSLLEKTDDALVWELLNNYISNVTNGSQEILEAFLLADRARSSRLLDLLGLCLRLTTNNK